MKFYIVDAFTESLFGGNPAGVVILDVGKDFPPDEVMRKTAAELRYSETAFIKRLDEITFNIRYFTPADEVDLCGHATIGSFVCLKAAGLVKDGNTYTNITKAGTLNIQLIDGNVMMDMAAPVDMGIIDKQDDIEKLYRVMGGSAEGVTMLPRLISTGLPDIIMPVKDRAALDALKPDMAALSHLSESLSVTGVHAFTLGSNEEKGSKEIDSQAPMAYCRNFAPLYGIDEEAATGTSNGALTYYLYLNNIIKDGDSSLIIQGEKMLRPSKIFTYFSENVDSLPLIKVGGSGVILAEGNINL